MKNKIVFLWICIWILLFLSLIELSFVNAGELTNQYYPCYQETANVSTSCGGKANGYYIYSNDYWINKSQTIDGNNQTGAYVNISASNISSYRAIYAKPINVYNTSKVFYYDKDGFGDIFKKEYDITNDCWSYSNNYLEIKITNEYNSSQPNPYNFTLWCWGESETYNLLYTASTSTIPNYVFTEEGINWNMSLLYENSQTYNSTTYETSKETFKLNASYDTNFNTINAYLNYNGTSYLGNKIDSGNIIEFSKSIDIPLINTDGEKKLFYWTIELTNTTGTYYYNSTLYNQTVYLINMSNQTSLNVKALNFTAYDQKTGTKLTYNFKGSLNYFTGSGIYSKNISITELAGPEAVLYIRNNTNYKISGTIQYSADGYATTDFNFINYQINNQTQNLSLYLLNLTYSTSFILKVQDNNQVPLSDYLIYIYRYDIGNPTPFLVQITKTDDSGKSIAFLETETVDYKFVITDSNGTIVYTSEKRKIIPETTPYTLIFTVGYTIPSPFEYYDNYTGIDYTLTFNKDTFIVTYVYTDSNSSFTNASIIVKYLNSSNNQSIVCNDYLNNPSGVLVCNIGNYSGTYSATAYISRGDTILTIDNIVFTISTFSKVLGMIGLISGFFIILIFGTAFLYNEVAGILSINIAIIFVQLIGLINFGWVFIFGIIGVSVLILIVLERG